MSIKVLLVDDNEKMRAGLRALLEPCSEFDVLGDADSGRAAIELVEQLRPDVVVMDVAMPGMSGLEATDKVIKKHPGVKVLALSMHSDVRYVRGMLAAGASGYALKDRAAEDLPQAIRMVVENKTFISPGVVGLTRDR